MNYDDPKSPVCRGLVSLLWQLGFPIHRIAALFDVNQGRIAEVVRDEPRSDVDISTVLPIGRAKDV